MDDIVIKLAERHELWLRYLKAWGCNPDTAKDLVQEMYIKIDLYIKKYNKNIMFNDDEVNYFFVYTTLYKMFIDLKRKEKRVAVYSLDDVHPNYREFLNEYIDYEDEQKVYLNKNKALTDWYNNKDFCELTSLESGAIDRLDKKKLLNYYLRKIFEEVFINKKSITQLSKDTTISYYSLYNTLRNIKEQIKKNYETR